MDLIDINFSTSAAAYWWRPAAWLHVAGADAETFLQGQFTNDLRGLQSGNGAVYGLWLDLKGKVLADSFVLRGVAGDGAGAEYWIGSYFSPAAVIRERLENYIIADDVIIEDATTEWAGVSLVGQDGLTVMEGRPGLIFRGRRGCGESVEWVFPIGVNDEVQRQLAKLPGLEAGEMERRRVEGRIPAVPTDIGPGDLPNEGALEAEAISYTKGCYLGQEVMARLKSMGKVRRRLLRVKGAAAYWPPLPAPLFVGERKIGELRSAVREEGGGFVGLAMLSLLHLTPGVKLALTVGTAPTVQWDDEP